MHPANAAMIEPIRTNGILISLKLSKKKSLIPVSTYNNMKHIANAKGKKVIAYNFARRIFAFSLLLIFSHPYFFIISLFINILGHKFLIKSFPESGY